MKTALITLASLAAAAMSPALAEAQDYKVRIRAGDQTLAATFLNNATARALVARFPLTVPMRDLYGRELVHPYSTPNPHRLGVFV